MILLKGGQGYTIDDAIKVIGAKNSIEGVTAEYNYLEQRFGQKDRDWKLISQSLVSKDKIFYDKLTISCENKKTCDIFFDITGFFMSK